jgi:hypothetical protein
MEEVLSRNLCGATDETHENVGSVTIARFVGWTLRSCRLAITAMNVKGNDEARQYSNPTTSDDTDELLHLFCACVRFTVTS